jgi:hypothetical protein
MTRLSDERREELLFDYLADALTPPDREEFERFLSQEPRWAERLENERRLDESLRVLPPPPLPSGLAERLKKGVIAQIETLDREEAFERDGGRILDLGADPDDTPRALLAAERPRRSSSRAQNMAWWAMAASTILILAVAGLMEMGKSVQSQVGASTQKMVGSIAHDAQLEDYGADSRVSAEKARENLMTHGSGGESYSYGQSGSSRAAAPAPVVSAAPRRAAAAERAAPSSALPPAIDYYGGLRGAVRENQPPSAPSAENEQASETEIRETVFFRRDQALRDARDEKDKQEKDALAEAKRREHNQEAASAAGFRQNGAGSLAESPAAAGMAPLPKALANAGEAPEPVASLSAQSFADEEREEALARSVPGRSRQQVGAEQPKPLTEEESLAVETLEFALERAGMRLLEKEYLPNGKVRLAVAGYEQNLIGALAPSEGYASSGWRPMIVWNPSARQEELAQALRKGLAQSLPAFEEEDMPTKQTNMLLQFDYASDQDAIAETLPLLQINWERRPLEIVAPARGSAVSAAPAAAPAEAETAGDEPSGDWIDQAFPGAAGGGYAPPEQVFALIIRPIYVPPAPTPAAETFPADSLPAARR